MNIQPNYAYRLIPYINQPPCSPTQMFKCPPVSPDPPPGVFPWPRHSQTLPALLTQRGISAILQTAVQSHLLPLVKTFPNTSRLTHATGHICNSSNLVPISPLPGGPPPQNANISNSDGNTQPTPQYVAPLQHSQ
jgi:hypothetical protein